MGAVRILAMKTRVLNFVMGIVAAFGLSSCIQSHTVVSVNKDGTATIVEKTMLGGMMAQMMAGFGDAFGQPGEAKAPANPLMDRATYEAQAKKMGEGVTLTKLEETKDAKGGMGVTVTYAVADINKLKLSMGADMPEAMKGMAPEIQEKLDEAGKEEEPVTFSFKAGELKINLPQPEIDPATAKANKELEGLEPELQLGPEEAQQMEMAKMMLADMSMSLTVKVNGDIAKTNASHAKGNEVTLFSMKFADIMKDPGAFSKLAMLGEDMQDKSKAMEMMKTLPGVKVETKKEVSISIK
ncbi:MAG: hypothetical protein ACI9R3_002577 [Verrucomicrobiales bacterium]|jgi:hypothetical protein